MYQDLLNDNQFEKLEELLPQDSLLLLLPSQKRSRGNREILKYWQAEKKLGMGNLKLKNPLF